MTAAVSHRRTTGSQTVNQLHTPLGRTLTSLGNGYRGV